MELNPLMGFTISHKWKTFITDFSGTMKVVILKLCTNMDSGLLYSIYQNRGQGPITFGVKSHDRFTLQFAINEKLIGFTIYHQWNIFVTDFSGSKALKLKLGTCMHSGLMYPVYQNQGQGPITLRVASLDRFYNLPLMKNFHHRHFPQEL